MKKTFITDNSRQTQKLGELLARELKGSEIICLTGELGGGKTTFAQGVLEGLGVKGPHTSPTFIVMRQHRKKDQSIYHLDVYRAGAEDIINLGWEEIIADKKNVIIVEWADRIKRIVPKRAVWINFEHQKDINKRKITLY
jgi:tRNA threonylcarbamoyladenosine biosynthesis protein TsaE